MSEAIDPNEVTLALEAEGLKVESVPNEDRERSAWALSFNISGFDQRVYLTLPSQADYFLAASVIDSPALKRPLEQLPADVARLLLALQGEVLLAKIDVLQIDDDVAYLAISPCSRIKWTGPKLRNRLHACARLAVNVKARLAAAEPTRGSRFG